MLQEAINAEVDGFIEQHRDRQDEQSRRMVKNGSLPAREILTGAGPINGVETGSTTRNTNRGNTRTMQN